MKNGSISEQISMQEKMLASQSENRQIGLDANVNIGEDKSIDANMSDLGLSSALGIFTPEVHGENVEELKKAEELKRKKRNRGMIR